MVKSIISIIFSIILIIVGTIYEQFYIKNSFDEIKENAVVLYDKIKEETATKDDVLNFQNIWISKKEKLHIFIPHNDIKEFDLWIAESTTFVENKKYDDALSKIDVVIELCEQIPKFYFIKLENIC